DGHDLDGAEPFLVTNDLVYWHVTAPVCSASALRLLEATGTPVIVPVMYPPCGLGIQQHTKYLDAGATSGTSSVAVWSGPAMAENICGVTTVWSMSFGLAHGSGALEATRSDPSGTDVTWMCAGTPESAKSAGPAAGVWGHVP